MESAVRFVLLPDGAHTSVHALAAMIADNLDQMLCVWRFSAPERDDLTPYTYAAAFRQGPGDWDKLADHLRQEVKTNYGFRRYAVEGFLCHLQHLRQTLDEAELTVQDLLSNVEPDLLRRQRYKARQKILKDSPPDHEASFWMRHTPRVEREARALRGYWPRFPVSPDAYAEQMARLFKPSGFYSEDQSFGLERKLSAFIERKEAHASDAECCASGAVGLSRRSVSASDHYEILDERAKAEYVERLQELARSENKPHCWAMTKHCSR